MNEIFREILNFWFSGSASENVKHRWFLAAGTAEQTAFDQLVREKFAAHLETALTGAYEAAAARDARSTLALIILLDQLSRHVFRDEPARLVPCDVKASFLAHQSLEVSRPFSGSHVLTVNRNS
jgi:uncharacterized protein (DUF924 family)